MFYFMVLYMYILKYVITFKIVELEFYEEINTINVTYCSFDLMLCHSEYCHYKYKVPCKY